MSVIQGKVIERGNSTVLAEIKARFSNALRMLVQADISTITYSVYNEAGDVVSGHDEVSLTVSDIILDTPITATTDESWTLGGSGYNFVHDLAADAFPSGDQVYRYEAELTYADGRTGWVIARLECQGVLTS